MILLSATSTLHTAPRDKQSCQVNESSGSVILKRVERAIWPESLPASNCDALPLYRQEGIIQRHLVKQPALQADETTLQVLDEPDRDAQNKFYMWIYRTTGQLGSPFLLYDYQTGRDHEQAEAFPEGSRVYSTVETAKANGLELYAWLRHVLTEVPQLSEEDSVEHRLPVNLSTADITAP